MAGPTREELLERWLLSHRIPPSLIAATLEWRKTKMDAGEPDMRDDTILQFALALHRKNVDQYREEAPSIPVRVQHQVDYLIPPVSMPWWKIIAAGMISSALGAAVGPDLGRWILEVLRGWFRI